MQDVEVDATAVCITVSLPAPLMRLFPGAQDHVEMEVFCVGSMIDELDRRWPGMKDRLCDSTPAIRKNLNIFVEGRRAKLDTPLKANAKVTILTAMSGG